MLFAGRPLDTSGTHGHAQQRLHGKHFSEAHARLGYK